MEYSRIAVSQVDALWELQKSYKTEIEEDIPGEQDLILLKEAYAWKDSGAAPLIVGCADCDVEMYQSLGFSIRLGNLLAFE